MIRRVQFRQPGFAFTVVIVLVAAARQVSGAESIDTQVCAKCHREIADSYAQTGMGRSFFIPSAATTSETYEGEFYHALSDTHFTMLRLGAELFQRRWQIGFDGSEINVEQMKIDYVMGSGNHARSFLHRTARGTLIELPLGWYPEGGGHWAMSPGSDSDHPRTRRFVSYKCMFCHNAVPLIPARNQKPSADPVFQGDLPHGIDCQRCHGPGAKHIQVVQTRGSTHADVVASIVNPARLSAKSRMEVCMQCHLETSSDRIPSVVVKFNRAPFSFIPGEPLDAFMLTFDHAPGTGHDEKFEAVSSVYRLRQSQCFLKSGGVMTCETCHNPHRIPRGTEAAAHYTAVCRTCHESKQGAIGAIGAIDGLIASGKHTASPDCTSCHMPRRRAEDTPGMVMTDHRIARRPPPGDLLAQFREPPPQEYRGEVVPYYPAPLPATPANKLYQAVAQVGLGNNVKAGLPVLAREMAAQKPRDAEFYIVLGDGWRSAGKLPQAVAAYEQAVRLGPDSVSALRSLASALSDAGQASQAAETLQRALQIDPSDALTWYRYGMLDYAAGRTQQAAEKIRKAIAIDPDLPDQSRSLGEVLLSAGQFNEAQLALREALRTDPYDDSAWDLQARLLTEKGQIAEALFDFGRAIRLNPHDASHLYDYAFALVRMKRFDEAQTQVEAALRENPKLPEAHELSGGLLEQSGHWADAAREYRQALALGPDLSRIHLRLGTVLAAAGDREAGADQLRIAAKSADAAVAQQASQALLRLGSR